MELSSQRKMPRTPRSRVFVVSAMLSTLFCLMGLIWGVASYYDRQNQAEVEGQISAVFMTTEAGDNSVFHLRYVYSVNGVPMTDTKVVSQAVYEQSIVGQPITVYYERDNPAATSLQSEGWIGFSIAMIVVAGAGLLLSAVFWFFFFRQST